MAGEYRKDIHPGLTVAVVLKKDQRSGKLTPGVVREILTSAPFHSRGIKVRLEDGQIGRVRSIGVPEGREMLLSINGDSADGSSAAAPLKGNEGMNE